MLLPSLYNKKIYDGIVERDIIGIKISPCENFIAIVSLNSIQIVSNRRNRVLVARKYLDSKIVSENDGFILFNGNIQWSENSQLIALGLSSNKHVVVYDLNLISPLDFSDVLIENMNISTDENDSDKDKYIDSEVDGIDDNVYCDYVDRDNREIEIRIDNNGNNTSEFIKKEKEVESTNLSKKFFFLTEEIESGLIKVPKVCVPDDVMDSFQDDLLSFQLVSEYGTFVDGKVVSSELDSEAKGHEVENAETAVEFSTSFCKIKLLKVINLYYNFSSFVLMCDKNTADNVLLFSLLQNPIMILVPISNPNKRKNILLNEFATHLYGNNINESNTEHFNSEFDYNFDLLKSPLIPVLSPTVLTSNCVSEFLNESENNNSNREVKLDNLNRKLTSIYIKESLQTKREILPSDVDSYQSIIEYLITVNNYDNSKDYKFEGDSYKDIGIKSITYNNDLDFISLLIKPWNSLLLFSWNNSFSKIISKYCSPNLKVSHCNKSNDMLIGLILKSNGIVQYDIIEQNSQPLIVSISSICFYDYENGLFNGTSSFTNLSYDYHDDQILDNKHGFNCYEDNNYAIQVHKLVCNSHSIGVECIFNVEISKVIGGLTNGINSIDFNFEMFNNSDFMMLTLSKVGIVVIDIITGKIVFTINTYRRSNSDTHKTHVNDTNNGQKHTNSPTSPITIISSKVISNGFGLLIQIKDHHNNNQNKLIEIPIYKLVGLRSAVCSSEDEYDDLSCENLVFIGIDDIRIAQCNSRNLNLDFNSESQDDDFFLNHSSFSSSKEFGGVSSYRSRKDIEDEGNVNSKYPHLSPNTYAANDESNGMTSCSVFTGDLSLESIKILPSIYINHNWLINEAYLNRSGNYLLISGFRACAIYDITNSRWRLFCDFTHELLLCKPNLHFGWVTEHLFFLVVDCSLLLTTFHDLITSNDQLWEMSVFEKNLMYEKYIHNLENRLHIGSGIYDDNNDLCIVFFDVRKSLDIKNIVGIIPFCSNPLLLVNCKKNLDDSFIVYFRDYSLICYESDTENGDFVPTKTKWLIDLSSEWLNHPIEMLLIHEDQNSTVILTLSYDYKLYKLVVFHNGLENSLNSKCRYLLESLLPGKIPLSIRFQEEIEGKQFYADRSDLYVYNSNKILKFGYYCISKKNVSIEETNNSHQEAMKANVDNLIDELTDNLIDVIKLFKKEYKLADNFEIKNLLFDSNLLNHLSNTIKLKDSNKLSDGQVLQINLNDELDFNFSGYIWYINQNNDVFFLPVTLESFDCISDGFSDSYSGMIKKNRELPVFVKSYDMKSYFTYLINFVPHLGSLFALESSSNIYIREEACSGISPMNSGNVNGLKVKFTLNQTISPLIHDIVFNSNKNKKYTLIDKLITPVLSYFKFYKLKQVFNILVNVFENMVFCYLSNSCKDYKLILKQTATEIISFLNNNNTYNMGRDNELGFINNYFNDVLQIYLSNIKLSEFESNDSEKFALFGVIIKEIISNSFNFKELRETIDYIVRLLDVNISDSNKQCISYELFSYFVISIIRKTDSIISPCIIFPIINFRPIEIFSYSLSTKDFGTAMLYLTLLQSHYGPYSVRFEHSMTLLHNILLDVNITNYDNLLRLSSSLIKFILLILKPSGVSLKIPLSKQNFDQDISIIDEYCLNNNSDLNCVMFVNKIEGIVEYHFISKLIRIEWVDLIIMCDYLDLNFNLWFLHCVQKYKYLWFNREPDINFDNYNLSENFKDLVIAIQSKFHFFGIDQNTFCFLNEDCYNSPIKSDLEFCESETNNLHQVTRFNQCECDSFVHFELNSPKIISSSRQISEFFFNNVLKRFFSAFLSNFMPIPALAIAHACNDVQSVHKILNDFPNYRMQG